MKKAGAPKYAGPQYYTTIESHREAGEAGEPPFIRIPRGSEKK
jgi:hypothetical protein